LTDREVEILSFERTSWRYGPDKYAAIWDHFHLTPTAYQRLLGALMNQPEAYQRDPELIRRLRELRDAQARANGR
jgi:hypothetical protein